MIRKIQYTNFFSQEIVNVTTLVGKETLLKKQPQELFGSRAAPDPLRLLAKRQTNKASPRRSQMNKTVLCSRGLQQLKITFELHGFRVQLPV